MYVNIEEVGGMSEKAKKDRERGGEGEKAI